MGGYKQIEEGFFTNNLAEGANKRLSKQKGRPYWYLLVLRTNEGGNGECKDKMQTFLTRNSLALKTNHQNLKSCAEQDPNEK